MICIDDVESIIQSELASSASAGPVPTKLVGVPPSRGRGGNQTPRSESIYITGSQPLPSPSSSYGSSPMLDRWAFGMSKIDGDDGAAGAGKDKGKDEANGKRASRGDSTEQATEAIGNVSLNSSGSQQHSAKVGPGPSLLTQQAPPHGSAPRDAERSSSANHTASSSVVGEPSATTPADSVPLSTSAMSVDQLTTLESGSSESHISQEMLNVTERITVKIADLGNGESFQLFFSGFLV